MAAIAHAQLGIDVFNMIFDRFRRSLQDHCDHRHRLAISQPFDDLGFTRRQQAIGIFAMFGRVEIKIFILKTMRGDPIHEAGIYWRVRRAIEAAFGVPINPHLFRDIAATSVVDLTPENIGIAAPLLGHINPKTTEEHYIQANQAIAGERYRSSVSVLRDHLSREYGDPFQPKGGV
jgi:integrase